jgi:hypothetical protein
LSRAGLQQTCSRKQSAATAAFEPGLSLLSKKDPSFSELNVDTRIFWCREVRAVVAIATATTAFATAAAAAAAAATTAHSVFP